MDFFPWTDDAAAFALARRELNSALIGDVLDLAGHRRQFLPPGLQPLRDDMIVCGRAMPVLEADDEGGEGPGRTNDRLNQPFGLMLEALDDLGPGEVYLCSGASPTYALWGELMTTCARNRGAVGAVVHGWSRDTRGILAQDFPCFSLGRYARDQRPRGKVLDFRCRLRCGETEIQPGDVIFGDWEGVVVVPREIERDIFTQAWAKARGERRVHEAIKSGLGARAAWDTYGIL